jgi:hypothetical protein
MVGGVCPSWGIDILVIEDSEEGDIWEGGAGGE